MATTEDMPQMGSYWDAGGGTVVLRFIAVEDGTDEPWCVCQNQQTGKHFVLPVARWLQPIDPSGTKRFTTTRPQPSQPQQLPTAAQP